MTTRTAPSSAPTREALAPLLLRRFRLITVPVLAGDVAFGALHVWFREPQLGFLLALKLAFGLLTIVAYWYATKHPTRDVIVNAILLVGASLNAVTALTGVIIGNNATSSLLYVVITLAACSFIPWGAGAQSALVLSALAAAVAPLFAEAVDQHHLVYDVASLAVTFVLSIYIARETERETLAGYRNQASARALADSRADFEGLFRTSNVLLAMIEPTEDDFVYTDLNDTLAAVFGHTVESMRGMTGQQLGFSPAEVQSWRDIMGHCAVAGSAVVPEYQLRVTNPPRWFHISFSAIRSDDGSVRRFSGVGVDITELKQSNDRVQSLNQNLEVEVRDRTALLEAANRDLESFAYSVSHDLRTPLRAIEGFAAILAEEHSNALPKDGLHQLGRIRGASQHMARLIDDILILSRAGRSEMTKEVIDLTELAGDVALDVRAARGGRKVEVKIAKGLLVQGDERLLRIVLANLLDNAWKYTGLAEDARIEVGSEDYNGKPFFFVRDNGCGFDMKFVEKLFQPFQRLHAAEEYDGTGVGLATVARIIRRHGGTVAAVGEVGAGSTFYFSVDEDWGANAS